MKDSDHFLPAAKLTVAFILLYELTFVHILVYKKRLLRQHQQQKKPFDRYQSPQMQTADRLQANFLEWAPIFLGLLWSLATTSNLSSHTVVAAWTYLALRLLYIFLVLKNGVASNGMNRALWISTFPSYFCLLFMTQHAVRSILM